MKSGESPGLIPRLRAKETSNRKEASNSPTVIIEHAMVDDMKPLPVPIEQTYRFLYRFPAVPS